LKTFGPLMGRVPCAYCLMLILRSEFQEHKTTCYFRPKIGSNKRPLQLRR
jgi:hypothetical protein